MFRTACRWVVLATAIALLWCSLSEPAHAQKRGRKKSKNNTAAAPMAQAADHRSKNFVLHTDLPADEAQELLRKLETMLSLVSRYWGRPNRQPIEVYAVKELDNWPRGSLDPEGMQSIAAGGGLTISHTLKVGNTMQARSVSYAIAEGGTPLHESVHAYCAQTFGTLGPVWYSEGMAEMGQYWREDDSSVHCDPHVVEYLHSTKVKSLNEIVNGTSWSGDSWQDYAWRWALCHLLANNENYRDRFRPLGLGLLTGADVSFEEVYGAMAPEISFEYVFFIEHLDVGFRADLCSWDWKSKSRPPRPDRQTQVQVAAARGWQPSRIRVETGQVFEYSTRGTWKTSADAAAVDGAGDAAGLGRVEGVLFEDYKLGEPFELGSAGTFTAAGSGEMFLRCKDDWNAIADNSGQLSVQLKLVEGEPASARRGSDQ